MRSKQTVGLAATLALVGWCASAAIAVAEPEPAPGPPPGPVTTFEGSGTYAVGTEITPGTYSSAGPTEDGSACYWKRVSNGKLVDNAMSKKAQIVKIEVGDTSFKTSDCQQWNKINDCLPGCGPQGATPAAILGQLGQIVLGNPGGPPPATGAAPPAPAAPAAPSAPATGTAPAGTGPAPGPAEAAS